MTPSEQRENLRNRGGIEVPISRRTVLKTGVLTSGTLVSGVSAGRAVARRGGEASFRPKNEVLDRADPDPDTAIVLAELDVSIGDWIVYGNETVADHNPAYDPEQPVVVVAFEHLLASEWPDWQKAEPEALLEEVIQRGIKFHAFPRRRLERRRSRGDGRFAAKTAVIDREDPDPDTAFVLGELDVPISDWIVYGNETVADHNRRYDPEEPVVVVAFEELLESAWPEWRRGDPGTLFDGVVERGIKFHAFPRSRLDRRRSGGSR